MLPTVIPNMKLNNLIFTASSIENPMIGSKPCPSWIMEFASSIEKGIMPLLNITTRKTFGPEIGKIPIKLAIKRI